MKLRDYQQRASDAILHEFETASSTLLVNPTGCVAGDTIIGLNRAGKGYSRTIKRAFESGIDPRQDRTIPTMVRAFLGYRIGLTISKVIVYSGFQDTYELVLQNGRKLRATPNHEVLTENGYVAIGALSGTDWVICEAPQAKNRGAAQKKNYRQVQGLIYHPFAGGAASLSIKPGAKNPEGRLYRVPYHRLVMEAAMNSLPLDYLIEVCRSKRTEASGLAFLDPKLYAVHHRDDNEQNNNLENLEVLTHSEHWARHGTEKNWSNFGYGLIGKSKVIGVRNRENIETYDVICLGPHHNFVANGIVAHNCGKTVIFADVIHRMQPARALVLAHRKELIWQAHDRIEEWTRLECDVEMGDLKANEDHLFSKAQVIVGTVQTQISGPADGRRRMSKFDPNEFGLLVLDECHHGTSDSYRDVINYYRQNPALKVLGVTATPDRADEEALGQILETVAFDYELLDAINDGWLVDIVQRCATVKSLDYSEVRTTAGDLNGGDLSTVMEAEENIQGVVQPTLEAMFRLPDKHLSGIQSTNWPAYLATLERPRRTIVFTVSKKQAEITCEVFNRSIPNKAAWVCDSTPPEKRASILQDFKVGKITLVANCGILTEGYDNPVVELIVMARATKSRSLYAQMCGRSTRPLPGIVDAFETAEERREAIKASEKPYCVVLDFVGNSGRHKLVTSAELLGGNVSDRAIERAKKLAQMDGKPVNMRKALNQAQAEIDREDQEAKKQEEARRRSKLVAKVDYRVKFVNPFDILDLHPIKPRGWDTGKTLSEKQRNLLRKQGCDPDSMSYTQGHQLLQEMFRRWRGELATLGQCKVLKRFGMPTDISRKEASNLIDQLAKNNWRPLPLRLENKT